MTTNYGDLLIKPIHPSCRVGCQAIGALEIVVALTADNARLRAGLAWFANQVNQEGSGPYWFELADYARALLAGEAVTEP